MTETTEAPAPETAGADPKPAPGAEVAIRTQPAAMAMSAKLKYAEMLAKSGLLPKDYRYNPANVLYGVEYGQMLGLQPMAAITGIHVIEGKPTASAGLISALVRRAGHKLRVGYDLTKMTGWAEIVRSDDPGYTFRSEWNLDRAVTAELCTIKNGKPFALDSKGKPLPWQKFYPSMTKARAITEVARDACEEILFGLHYTPEELGAAVDGDGSVITGEIVEDDPLTEWVRDMTAQAGEFATDDDGRKLWKQVADKVHAGEVSKSVGGDIMGVIKERWRVLGEQASQEAAGDADAVEDAETVETVEGVIVIDLPEGDEWAEAIAGIASQDDAERLLAELEQAQMDDDRRARIIAAISLRVSDLAEATA